MSDLYRITEIGENHVNQMDGMVEFVISERALLELIRTTIVDLKGHASARQIADTVLVDLLNRP